MRDTISHSQICLAFPDLVLMKDLEGHLIDLHGFQSVQLSLTWQQKGEGHSEENGLQLIFEEGETVETMEAVGDNVLRGSRPYSAQVLISKKSSKDIHHLALGYDGSCRFIRLCAKVIGKSETIVSGLFILGHASVSPVQERVLSDKH